MHKKEAKQDTVKHLCWIDKEAIQQWEYVAATGLIRSLFKYIPISFSRVDAVIRESPN